MTEQELQDAFTADMSVLMAAGMYHPAITRFDNLQYGLTSAVQNDDVVFKRLCEQHPDLVEDMQKQPPAMDKKSWAICDTHQDEFVAAIKSLTEAERAALRKRISAVPTWRAWAAKLS